jgi:orotidine-5'-phosphate decarboxylase
MLETAISVKDRLIVALDVPNAAQARQLVRSLGNAVVHYKIGLQLFTAEGPEFVRELCRSGKKVFLDLKLHDIPNTVAGAVKSIAELGCSMVTIHASGGRKMMSAAVEAAASANPQLVVLGVTVLTSMADDDLADVGLPVGAWEHTVYLGKLAQNAGCGGVIASPQEVQELRRILEPSKFIVTPGIRPSGANAEDQARIATPADALNHGADYLVIGRPITAASDPLHATTAILQEMEHATN